MPGFLLRPVLLVGPCQGGGVIEVVLQKLGWMRSTRKLCRTVTPMASTASLLALCESGKSRWGVGFDDSMVPNQSQESTCRATQDDGFLYIHYIYLTLYYNIFLNALNLYQTKWELKVWIKHFPRNASEHLFFFFPVFQVVKMACLQSGIWTLWQIWRLLWMPSAQPEQLRQILHVSGFDLEVFGRIVKCWWSEWFYEVLSLCLFFVVELF